MKTIISWLLQDKRWLIGILVPFIILILSYIFIKNTEENNLQTSGNSSPAIQNMENSQIIYSDIKDPTYQNERKESLSLSAIEIVESYFLNLNKNQFRHACSLLAQKKCNSENGGDVEEFSRERMKYINGYENLEIWEPELEDDFHSKIICVKYSYQLKADANPQPIWEVFSFYLDKREYDYAWEITSRVCERIFKEGVGKLSCQTPASRNFCI